MLENKLKLNNEKTEAPLMCSSSKSFSVSKPFTISVCSCNISSSSSARNLGFYITDDMSIELQIKNICRSAYSELCCIGTIQHLVQKHLCLPLSSRFLIDSHTMPGQRQSAHSDFVGSRVYACLGVTCHLHFWQNDWGLLRATVVTRGWTRHRNRSQHTKLTLEKKILLPGFELATFHSPVWRSNQQAILAPFRLAQTSSWVQNSAARLT